MTPAVRQHQHNSISTSPIAKTVPLAANAVTAPMSPRASFTATPSGASQLETRRRRQSRRTNRA